MIESLEKAQPLTEKETIKAILIDQQNEITKFELLEKVANREKLSGKGANKNFDNLAKIQSTIRSLKEKQKTFLDFYNNASEDVPLKDKL